MELIYVITATEDDAKDGGEELLDALHSKNL